MIKSQALNSSAKGLPQLLPVANSLTLYVRQPLEGNKVPHCFHVVHICLGSVAMWAGIFSCSFEVLAITVMIMFFRYCTFNMTVSFPSSEEAVILFSEMLQPATEEKHSVLSLYFGSILFVIFQKRY